MPIQETIKILFLAANPQDTTQLQINEEMRAIDQALRLSEFRDRFDIRQHLAVHVADLQALLLRHQPDIVHFSGHGSEASEIMLEDEAGLSRPVSIRALSQLFSALKDNIRCVVLNACYSKHQAEAIAQHIECVIGMSGAIGDKASISFSTAFYQALGYGRDVKNAFELGRLQIDMEDLGEEDQPQLLALQNNPSKIMFIRSSTEEPYQVDEEKSLDDMPLEISPKLALSIKGPEPGAIEGYLIQGKGFDSYKKGDGLVVYDDFGGATVAIALLNVTKVNPNSLSAQAVLVHPRREILNGLLVDDKLEYLSTSELAPAADYATGYLLREKRVRLRPLTDVKVETKLVALEPEIVDGAIVDHLVTPIIMRVTSIGKNGKVAVVELVEGAWPQTGTIVKQEEVEKLHTSPLIQSGLSREYYVQSWYPIAGIILLGVTIIFLMFLWIRGDEVNRNNFPILVLIAAFVGGAAFSFLGGWAQGHIRLSGFSDLLPNRLDNPVSFIVSGAIAGFVIVLIIVTLMFDGIIPSTPLTTSEQATPVSTNEREIREFPISQLVGEWQTYWVTGGRSELLLVVIPDTPVIGQPAGTIGYIYTDKAYHCGIDILYVGFDGTNHRFDAIKNSGDYTPVAGKKLQTCVSLGITPFDYYNISRANENIVLKQVSRGQEYTPTVLRSLEKVNE